MPSVSSGLDSGTPRNASPLPLYGHGDLAILRAMGTEPSARSRGTEKDESASPRGTGGARGLALVETLDAPRMCSKALAEGKGGFEVVV